MNNELFNLLLLEEGNKEISLGQGEKLYKEYEEAVKKFLENGANTDKIEEMTSTISKYCKECIDLLSEDALVEFLSEKLLNNSNDKSAQWEQKINSVIQGAVFLGKISALHTIFLKKQEEIRKEQEYRRSIQRIDGLEEVIKGIIEDNIPLERLCEVHPIKEAQLNRILNEKEYFNVRAVGHQRMISLAPEGKRLRTYLKHRGEKRYSQEELENYIYMNSHRLINMFRRRRDYLPKTVSVIPLSDVRQNCLSFEFKYVYNEISSRRLSIEQDFLHVAIGKISAYQIRDDFKSDERENSIHQIFDNFNAVTRRKEDAETAISKFSKAFKGNIAVGRI